MQTRKIPMRMCVGCGEMRPKRELIRVVKQPEGTIVLDDTGKRSGRGAYICRSMNCLKAARKSRRLEKSFSCRIEDAIYAALEEQMLACEQTSPQENEG